jgi:hypothetical protein
MAKERMSGNTLQRCIGLTSLSGALLTLEKRTQLGFPHAFFLQVSLHASVLIL